jgi:type IV pilus assembly protein PilC
VLEDQARTKKGKNIIRSIFKDIENGHKLSEGMEKFPKCFPPYLVEIIKVGEVSGELSDTLDNISINLERDYEISKKVVGAMMYPLIVISLMFIVMGVLIIYVLPQIAGLYNELGSTLPLPTRVLLESSNYLKTHPFQISGIVLLISAIIVALLRTKRGHYIFHYIMLRLPFFGELIKEFNLVRFFRGLEALFKSGVSIVNSIKIAKKTLKNDVYLRSIEGMEPILVHGVPLTDVLKPLPFLFPLQIQHMVEVGEQAGKFDVTFKHVVMYYERSINHKINTMNSFLEPALIVIVGFMVGALALSIFLPIYQVSIAF